MEGSFSTARTTPCLVFRPKAVAPILMRDSYLDGFNCVLYLENSSFGRESVYSSIVFVAKVRFAYLSFHMINIRFLVELSIKWGFGVLGF